MTQLETYVRKYLKGPYYREVKVIEVVGNLVRIFVDYGALNSSILYRLERVERVWKTFYPQVAVCIQAWNEQYEGRFPLDTVEAKLGSGIVSTTYD